MKKANSFIMLLISGERIDLIDGDTLKTCDWYQGQFQDDVAGFTYFFSRIEE